MKDGGFRRASRPISSHLCKPVLNGLSDLLRLPQYPVLGVRAAASTGVRREGELYTHAQAGGKRGMVDAQDGHKLGIMIVWAVFRERLRHFHIDNRRCRENCPFRPCDDPYNVRSPPLSGKRAPWALLLFLCRYIARRSSKRKGFLPMARHQPSLCKAFPVCNLRW